jgi:hypothetical protein
MIALSERGSLIVPLPHDAFDLKERVEVDGVALRPKVELHLTVFNHGIGKLVQAARAAQPGLGGVIESIARELDLTFRPTGPYLALRRGKLTTVVVRGEAAIAELFARVKERVAAGELRDALDHPGPPHVTLYTSDPAGTAGIGLATVADLEAALERGRRGERSGALSAWELPGPP